MKVNNKNLQILSSIIFFAILMVNFSFPPSISAQKGAGNISIDRLPSKEKRWALIIGVDTYQKDISPLYGTVNDAKALRDVLIKHAGFTDERIILMTTDSNDSDLIPNKGNIIYQLDKLQRVVPDDGLILFSFSGHGVSIGSDAFIVPSDGRIYQDADLMRESAVDVLRIRRAIQNTKVKQVIMFLDACRNDPVRAKGDVDNNLTTAYAKGFSFETKNQNIEAYATLYATSFGDRAYEFLDKKTNKYRGYFSYAIEEGLKGSAANNKGEVTLAGLIRYIEDTVKERVRINENQRQIPYPATEGFRNSDLVIAVADRNTPITTNPNSSEATFWSAIENSNDVSDFEEYLRRTAKEEFSGIYKSTAELKIRKLKKLKYNEIGLYKEGLAWVKLNDKYGIIDETEREIISPKYNTFYSNGLVPLPKLPSKDKRWALIIGVENYQDNQIPNLLKAANVAKNLADSLEKYAGFPKDQIFLLSTSEVSQRQPTRANIMKILSSLKYHVPEDGLLLVSFSGHGIEYKGTQFLIPSDANINENINVLEETAISVETMKLHGKNTQVKQVLMFFTNEKLLSQGR